MAEPGGSQHVRDAGSMRALAHPTRLRLLGELRAEGPRSVGGLAGVVDEAPGSVSYHLGVLAEHGFVAEAPELARSRRERWYRATHERSRWDVLDVVDDPEARAALDVLRATVHRRYAQVLEDYLAREAHLPREWVAAAASGDELLHLRADQLAQLREDLHALASRYARLSDREDPDAEGVMFVYHAFRR
ncbi:helix-turn-helix transcriptional regulator [uncultured Pseudokineococcus sp.]|uniref:ArsR/SmtB family transcription factor n=1 Tax=uncultured Pseudokineococcus sp. TaxID=1642928 RepID=UPI0026383E26|nr:helix-turn-helix domain-containing protein [uncultured Pseudokineococcus sp.]